MFRQRVLSVLADVIIKVVKVCLYFQVGFYLIFTTLEQTHSFEHVELLPSLPKVAVSAWQVVLICYVQNGQVLQYKATEKANQDMKEGRNIKKIYQSTYM